MKYTATILIAFGVLLPSAFAQAPAPAATPAAKPPASATPAADAAVAPPKSPKPLSPVDIQSVTKIVNAMQFHLKMGETGKSRAKFPEAVKFGTDAHKAMLDLWKPLSAFNIERNVDIKYAPVEPTKRDKEMIVKLGKEKEERWLVEYFELFGKGGRHYATNLAATLKQIADPDLKKLGESVLKLVTDQAQAAETARAEAKKNK